MSDQNYGYKGVIPLGVTIADNVQRAQEYQATHTPQETAWWFYETVKNNKDEHLPSDQSMDYKQLDSATRPTNTESIYADFGNYNYGVVGRALGFPAEILEYMAGWAQSKDNGQSAIEAAISAMLDPKYYSDNPEDQKTIAGAIQAADEAGVSKNDFGLLDYLKRAFEQAFDVVKGNLLDALKDLNPELADLFNTARNWTQPRDPLALDLDADGLETTGITASPILFDHDGDGIKTGTGWVNGDDALLVLDKNNNGSIDNGNELFGVDTLLANGQKAANGFAALAELDSNHDGHFNSSDSQYTQVQIWRDLNQDGNSQAGELQSLAQAGIASINLNNTASPIDLGNGNIQSASATYTKTDGSTGTAANLDLAANPFYRKFSTKIPSTVTTQNLPDIQGSGAVRDLREAATTSSALANRLQTLINTGNQSRASLINNLDSLIDQWAKSSGFNNSKTQAESQHYHLHYLLAGMNPLELSGPGATGSTGDLITTEQHATWQAKIDRITHLEALLAILEPFNGINFVNLEAAGARTGTGQLAAPQETHDPVSGLLISRDVYVSLSDAQISLLEQSYGLLKQSVYDGLVMQTRLRPYLDGVGLSVGAANDWDWRRVG